MTAVEGSRPPWLLAYPHTQHFCAFTCGCFCKLRVLLEGVVLLYKNSVFGAYVRVPEFLILESPKSSHCRQQQVGVPACRIQSDGPTRWRRQGRAPFAGPSS